MFQVTRRLGGQDQTFSIYTREEADAKGIVYVPWRESTPGMWALTDDGYVAQCLRLQEFTDKRGRVRRLYAFTFGRTWLSPKTVLSFTDRSAVRNWSSTSARSWAELEARKNRTKEVVRFYVVQKLTTGKIDYNLLGRIYRRTEAIPAASARRLFKLPQIKRMIEEETTRVIEANGWSVRKVAVEYSSLIEECKRNGDLRNLRLVLEHLSKTLEMMPPRRRR
jgi:hypothetical protein